MKLSIIGSNDTLRKTIDRIRKEYCEMEVEYYDRSGGWENIRSGAVIIPVNDFGVSFIDIIRALRKNNDKLRLILSGRETSQAVLLYKYRCDGFICENNLEEDILYCLKTLFKKEILNVRTFGGFEVFKCGKAVNFGGRRAKELFALCVDSRGQFVTYEKAVSRIWDDRLLDENVKQLFRRSVKMITEALTAIDAQDVFIRARGACAVDTTLLACDFYEYLEDPHGRAEFICGEYMSDYSWAENTRAMIAQLCPEYFTEMY